MKFLMFCHFSCQNKMLGTDSADVKNFQTEMTFSVSSCEYTISNTKVNFKTYSS